MAQQGRGFSSCGTAATVFLVVPGRGGGGCVLAASACSQVQSQVVTNSVDRTTGGRGTAALVRAAAMEKVQQGRGESNTVQLAGVRGCLQPRCSKGCTLFLCVLLHSSAETISNHFVFCDADIPCIDGVGATPKKPGPLDRLTGLINRKGDPNAIDYDDTKVGLKALQQQHHAVLPSMIRGGCVGQCAKSWLVKPLCPQSSRGSCNPCT